METKLRPYTKKELALMYFPDSTPETAVKHLKMMIRSNDMLWDELQEMGYNKRRKTFTPREVRAPFHDKSGTIGNNKDRNTAIVIHPRKTFVPLHQISKSKAL